MKKLSTNPVQNNATIFDRRRAEEELRRSDDQLLQAVRVAQFGIFDHDHLTGAVYWSPKYREIYGYSADEPASPPTFLASVHPDDLERIGAEILRAHDPAGAGAFDQEHRIVRRDGETRWVSTRSQTFFKAEGAARRPERTVGASIDITERKRADEQLALFRHSIEQAFVAVFWIDHRGGFTYVNEAACRSLGYDREELMRLQLWDIDPVYPREQWNKRWEEYERTKHDSVVRVESRHRRKDGSEFPVEVLCQFITVGDHAIHIAQVHDITEQKRAQEALTLFRTLIDHANDIIEVIDPETGRFLDVNNQACLAHGYTREEYLALTVADLDPVVADKSWEQIKKDMSGSGSIVLESLHRRKDGSAFPVEVNCVNIHLDRDYALAIVRDITERKRTEEALKASEARFRSAFENTAVGMMMIDAGGRFQRVNQAFCALVGYSEDELRAKTFLEITHPEDLEKNLPAVKQLMAGEMESFFVEKRYLHKQGHPVWVHASVAVVRDARGRPCGFIAQSQDITERRRAVEELERSVSLLHSTLESTADGILVVNHEGRIISFNQQFVEMWRLSAAVIDLRDDNQALAFVLDQLKEPEQFLKKVRELYDQPEAES
ncbi:MAG TPA: PAS domain S-box protein, partial [Gammaproteobacteria bacterium]|nr:PAS domain S-box protein [Gammaproteobacteria bacterium]